MSHPKYIKKPSSFSQQQNKRQFKSEKATIIKEFDNFLLRQSLKNLNLNPVLQETQKRNTMVQNKIPESLPISLKIAKYTKRYRTGKKSRIRHVEESFKNVDNFFRIQAFIKDLNQVISSEAYKDKYASQIFRKQKYQDAVREIQEHLKKGNWKQRKVMGILRDIKERKQLKDQKRAKSVINIPKKVETDLMSRLIQKCNEIKEKTNKYADYKDYNVYFQNQEKNDTIFLRNLRKIEQIVKKKNDINYIQSLRDIQKPMRKEKPQSEFDILFKNDILKSSQIKNIVKLTEHHEYNFIRRSNQILTVLHKKTRKIASSTTRQRKLSRKISSRLSVVNRKIKKIQLTSIYHDKRKQRRVEKFKQKVLQRVKNLNLLKKQARSKVKDRPVFKTELLLRNDNAQISRLAHNFQKRRIKKVVRGLKALQTGLDEDNKLLRNLEFASEVERQEGQKKRTQEAYKFDD